MYCQLVSPNDYVYSFHRILFIAGIVLLVVRWVIDVPDAGDRNLLVGLGLVGVFYGGFGLLYARD